MLITSELIDTIFDKYQMTAIGTDWFDDEHTLFLEFNGVRFDFLYVNWDVLTAATYYNDSENARMKLKSFMSDQLLVEVEITGDNGGVDVTEESGTALMNCFSKLLNMTVPELVHGIGPN
ncbi:MAG: hypothetical protein DRI37_09275 [Chloroflexi bacterium]|nr:MAG: hypothetical protein DRI37_09275 [Chloroflexota bacterium]